MHHHSKNSKRGFNQNLYVQQNHHSSQNPYYNSNNQNSQNSLQSTFDTANFIKGALIGAVGAYLFTNEKAQKSIFKTVAKGTNMFQAGMEEMKEKFEDAKAEMDAQKL